MATEQEIVMYKALAMAAVLQAQTHKSDNVVQLHP